MSGAVLNEWEQSIAWSKGRMRYPFHRVQNNFGVSLPA
jgi:hypothetical protein